MLHLVFAALLRAGFTNSRAGLADHLRSLSPTSHYRCSKPADLGTVDVKRDTTSHHLDIVFLQTCRCTHIASVCAVVAGIETALVLLDHDVLL